MKNYPIIRGSNFLTVIADKAYSITAQDGRFAKALEFVKNGAWASFFALMDKPAAIARYSKGSIQVFDGEIRYDGAPVHGVITERILKFMEEGFDFKPLVAFLENLYKNTDKDIRDKLYLFLENNQLAITERGSFLAFKLVNDNGTPIYYSTGTFLNQYGEETNVYEVGQQYFFPRDRIIKTNGECSSEGIYVGNKNYWNGQFDENNNYTGNGRMLIVEVYPQNVCNVPHSDATKIVVCELNVVDEYTKIVKETNASFYGDEDNYVAPDWSDLDDDLPEEPDYQRIEADDFWENSLKKTLPKRDCYGRFVGKKTVLQFPTPVFHRDAKGRFTPVSF